MFVWSVSALDKNFLRTVIQAGATLLSNLHLQNLTKGTVYRGNGKKLCVPGLNCYSCPAATASCPIGALQTLIGSKHRFSYYVIGFLILIGVLLGRAVCGFLCPFGWFQELLYRIPTKKVSTKKWKLLKRVKYLVLVLLVFLLPLLSGLKNGVGDPFFCKYLCPQGVLEAAIPLALADRNIRDALGPLFFFKSGILIVTVGTSIFIYRPFCKVLCPLGAFYALFNSVSFFQMQVKPEKCISCGKCTAACKMDVDVTKTPNHTECIRCGMCVSACPTGAATFYYGKGGPKHEKETAYPSDDIHPAS